ncbi:MAG: hypothetical protein RL318_2695 [Fibrobacterota bacterium]|jgi:hypothetical protein
MNIPQFAFLLVAGFSAVLAATVPSSKAATLVPQGNTTILLDSAGTTTLKSWNYGGYSAHLTDSATLLAQTGSGVGPGAPYGSLVEVSWSGTSLRTWNWKSANGGTLHHAHNVMPNGHWLAIGYNSMTKAQLAAKGVTISGTYIYDEHVLEYDPATQKVVWEWVASDHMGSTANRLLINSTKLATNQGDALHFNSVSYDPIQDLVMVSSHTLNEILVIDHSTTTAQAATHAGGKYGKGGDLIFRWGSAANYGGTSATVTSVFHGGNFVAPGCPGAGNFLAFANTDVVAKHSRAYEVKGTLADTGFVVAANGEYQASNPFSWYSATGSYESASNFGNVQRMPNGNTFITFTKSGKAVEVDTAGNIAQVLTISSNCRRAVRYPYTFKGLSNTAVYTGGTTGVEAASMRSWSLQQTDRGLRLTGLEAGVSVRVLDAAGRSSFAGTSMTEDLWIPIMGMRSGVHVVQVVQGGRTTSRTFSLLR